jgi:hypothetical protein
MSNMDELPPDQRAALSLLLSQRKTYAELSAVLGISEQAVHDRAHAALAVLAPRQAREVAAERRQEIGDYMLGQQRGVAQRLATRTFLGASEPGRAWARQLAAELAPLASDPLPDIPPASAAGSTDPDGASDRVSEPRQRADGAPPPSQPAHTGNGLASQANGGRSSVPLPSSRLGGALLLAGIVAAVVVAVILLTGGGGGGGGGGSHPKSTASAAAKSSSTGTGPKISQRLTLKPTTPGSKTVAAVEILSEGGKRAFYIAAEHLPPSRGFSYVIWLYNSPSSAEALTKAPTISSNERLAGGALLPENAGNFHEMLVTRETSNKPTQPGPIVLRGPFSLGG